jgi:glycosyltransferase involved in cell wall biosynthesis
MTKSDILHIIARMNIGGPALHVAQLSSGLMQNGFETTLVSGIQAAAEGDMTDLAHEYGLTFHLYHNLRARLSPWSDLYVCSRLWRLMRSTSPRIVHTHTAKAGALGRIAAKLSRVPIIVHTFHGHVFSGYWGPVISTIIVLVERMLARLSTVILTVSDTVRNELLQHNIAPPEKIHVLPLGLDLTEYKNCSTKRGQFRRELDIEPNVPLIGNVGRLVPIKNHRYFLMAAQVMVQTGFEGRFVIVGNGELASELYKQARELDIGNSVIFTGWRRDLDKIYADLDVLVNTSINEGTPFAIIEAMAARVPVVATSVGGVPDIIKSDETGYLVPENDVHTLVDGIVSALESSDAMLDAAQNHVMEHHNLESMVNHMVNLYNKLLKDKGYVV